MNSNLIITLILSVTLFVAAILSHRRYNKNSKPKAGMEGPKRTKVWKILTIVIASFVLLPLLVYYKDQLMSTRTWIIGVWAAFSLGVIVKWVGRQKLPYFKYALTTILTVSVIGTGVWGALYLAITDMELLGRLLGITTTEDTTTIINK